MIDNVVDMRTTITISMKVGDRILFDKFCKENNLKLSYFLIECGKQHVERINKLKEEKQKNNYDH